MAELVWDQVGERRYETGIDRGVLYHPEGFAEPWNGLVSVTPVDARETKPYFLDGMMYLIQQIMAPFAAKLQAFTYPDSLDRLIGVGAYGVGVGVHGQPGIPFNLSYRTRVANDVDDVDHGYKIHIIYDVLATPSDFTYQTIGAVAAPAPFEWTLAARPIRLAGFKPASHISFDSRYLNPENLAEIEGYLYGSSVSDPNLLSMADMLALAT